MNVCCLIQQYIISSMVYPSEISLQLIWRDMLELCINSIKQCPKMLVHGILNFILINNVTHKHQNKESYYNHDIKDCNQEILSIFMEYVQ